MKNYRLKKQKKTERTNNLHNTHKIKNAAATKSATRMNLSEMR